jgi:signal peptidase
MQGEFEVEGTTKVEGGVQVEQTPAKKPTRKRTIVKWVLIGILLAIILFLAVVVVMLCWDKYVKKSPAPSAFGYAGLIVTTGSMSGTIEEGDLVIITRTNDYKIGDIITFIGEDEITPTTHRIVGYDGDLYVTKGDANNVDDLVHIQKSEILGEVVCTIPHVGLFFQWVGQEGGWIYLVAVVAIVAVGVVLYKFTTK